jgi:hypothetical protein
MERKKLGGPRMGMASTLMREGLLSIMANFRGKLPFLVVI